MGEERSPRELPIRKDQIMKAEIIPPAPQENLVQVTMTETEGKYLYIFLGTITPDEFKKIMRRSGVDMVTGVTEAHEAIIEGNDSLYDALHELYGDN